MVIGTADKKKNLSNYLSKDNARSLNEEWTQEFQPAYTTIILTTFLFLHDQRYLQTKTFNWAYGFTWLESMIVSQRDGGSLRAHILIHK